MKKNPKLFKIERGKGRYLSAPFGTKCQVNEVLQVSSLSPSDGKPAPDQIDQNALRNLRLRPKECFRLALQQSAARCDVSVSIVGAKLKNGRGIVEKGLLWREAQSNFSGRTDNSDQIRANYPITDGLVYVCGAYDRRLTG